MIISSGLKALLWALRWGLGLSAIAYLGLCFGLWSAQRRLVFVPRRQLDLTPAALGLEHQTVRLPVPAQGLTPAGELHGWWLPAADAEFTLLYLHGNAGNIGSHLSFASRFQQVGLSVLLVDYRGYGLSSGPFPSEARIYEDAQVAWRYLVDTRGIAPEQIVIFGHSIGGAIAIDLARQTPAAAGLIVENTFTSMLAMAQRQGYGSWVPVNWLLTQRFDSLSKVSQLQLPILFIHGLADLTVPPEMSHQLYAAAPQPKWLWLVPGADHNTVAEVAGSHYEQQLQQFLSHIRASRCPHPPSNPQSEPC